MGRAGLDEPANDRYRPFRVGTHDDLVTAVGVGGVGVAPLCPRARWASGGEGNRDRYPVTYGLPTERRSDPLAAGAGLRSAASMQASRTSRSSSSHSFYGKGGPMTTSMVAPASTVKGSTKRTEFPALKTACPEIVTDGPMMSVLQAW